MSTTRSPLQKSYSRLQKAKGKMCSGTKGAAAGFKSAADAYTKRKIAAAGKGLKGPAKKSAQAAAKKAAMATVNKLKRKSCAIGGTKKRRK